jgi:DNA repair exonuclease SbcCD nuclease subunit
MSNKVVAVCTADWHLSLNPPIWRSVEKDWFAAMKRPLDEIQSLSEQYECPIILAGDIFDRWNSPPEIINFVMESRKDYVRLLTIAGQHDLPNHNFSDVKRSAYWTLCCGNVVHHENSEPFCWDDVSIYGFSFGFPLKPLQKKDASKLLDVAVVHDYVWTKNNSFPNAPKDKEIKHQLKDEHNIDGKYYGYDVIVYGDNHKGFSTKIGKTTIFNCGTLLRRKSDEREYCPQVGLLMSDGSVEPHFLDISKDKYLDLSTEYINKDQLDVDNFFKLLEELGATSLDFVQAVKEYLQTAKVSNEVKAIILKSLENV